MPLKLQIKRVRYGDCAVLEGRRSRLIVDCGSGSQAPDNSLPARAFAYAAIAPQINDLMPTHILISQLHPAHYRGFLELGTDCPPLFRGAPPVDTAYLPWTVLGGRAVLAAPFARLCLAAPPRTLAHELAWGLLELFFLLEREAASRQPLQAGDVFSLDGQKLEVLWPQAETALRVLPLCSGPMNFLDADRAMAEAFSAAAAPLLRGQVLGTARQLAAALERYLLLLHGGPLAETGRREALTALDAAMRQGNDVRRALWGGKEEELLPPYPAHLQPLARFARQQDRVLRDGLRACGLVVQWKDKALLPGDVSPAVLKRLTAEGRLHPRYQVIPVPCHGARREYASLLPEAERYILSNGGYRRRAIRREILDGLAPAGGAFLCTDAHTQPGEYCKFYRETGRCHPACLPITGAQEVLPL